MQVIAALSAIRGMSDKFLSRGSVASGTGNVIAGGLIGIGVDAGTGVNLEGPALAAPADGGAAKGEATE